MSRFLPIGVFVLAIAMVAALSIALFVTRPPEGGQLTGGDIPQFVAPGLRPSDQTLDISQLVGQPFMVNAYASWCQPCILESDELMQLADQGVPIYGLAWRDGAQEARAFLVEHGDPYRMVGIDRDGIIGKKLGVSGAPETIIVDARGSVVLHWKGEITTEALQRAILPAWRRAATQ